MNMDYDVKLIEEVKRYPELYDSSHRNFKNKEIKSSLWKDVAFKMRKQTDDYSVKIVRMRWKSLRDSYVKEIKYKMAISTGHNVKPRKNWRYSNCMTFLAPYLAISFPLPPNKNSPEDITREETGDQSFYLNNSNNNSTEEESNNGHFLGALLDFSKHDTAEKKEIALEKQENSLSRLENNERQDNCVPVQENSLSREENHFSRQDNSFSRQEYFTNAKSEGNDIDLFFKGVAETVKKLNVVNQVFIQRNIVNMVLDFKLREAQEKYLVQQRAAADND